MTIEGVFKTMKDLVEAHHNVEMNHNTQQALWNHIRALMGEESANAFSNALECSHGRAGDSGARYMIRGDAVYLWRAMKGSM